MYQEHGIRRNYAKSDWEGYFRAVKKPAVLGDGDIFGEVGFLTGRPGTASVIADGLFEISGINRFEIEKLIESTPDTMAKIENFYETRVWDTIRQIKS